MGKYMKDPAKVELVMFRKLLAEEKGEWEA